MIHTATDRFGREIAVGDRVIYSQKNGWRPLVGIVLELRESDDELLITKDVIEPSYTADASVASIIATVFDTPTEFAKNADAVIKMDESEYIELKLKKNL